MERLRLASGYIVLPASALRRCSGRPERQSRDGGRDVLRARMHRLTARNTSWLIAPALVVASLFAGSPQALAQTPRAEDLPQLSKPVNDFAQVIDPASAQELDALIRRLQSATSDVLIVATVKTFQPWPDLKSMAVAMFQNAGRGIGTKGKDNGMLILLAVNDRQVWVEVGYGLEGFVTDGFSGETSRDVMAPLFRTGAYGQGLLAGATRLAQRIAEGRGVTLQGVPVRAPERRRSTGGIPLGFWIFLAILLLNLVGRSRRRGMGWRAGRWASGVGAFGAGSGWSRGGWGSGGGGFGGGFGGGRSGGGGGGASW